MYVSCICCTPVYVLTGHIEGGEMGFACIPGKEAVFKTSLDKTLTYAKALNCKM